jgi:hypothetical protein
MRGGGLSRTGPPPRPGGMSIRAKRFFVAVLAVTAAVVGVWAAAFPVSF